jgi:proteasome lid subunit RPN8/RPN11
MTFFTVRNTWARLFPRKPLTCRRRLWISILKQLRERGLGQRESGGFLLGRCFENSRTIEAFLPYDVIDPNCLNGAILFDGSKMDLVWRECRACNLQVVADVHTHPAGYRQSSIDKANPMIPEKGHIAIIIPNFAEGYYTPGQIGMYEFRGGGKWLDHSATGTNFFRLKGLL